MTNDIFISSRVRLARNIHGYPFLLKDKGAFEVVKGVYDSLRKLDRFELHHMLDFKETAARAMMERHLISEDLIKNKQFGAVALSDDEVISVMLNEEDHVRQQCILKGLSLKESHRRLKYIDSSLKSEIKFAYHSAYGYLTSCLTN